MQNLPIEQLTENFALNAGRNPFVPNDVVTTYPSTWLEIYLQNRWFKLDPVAINAPRCLSKRKPVLVPAQEFEGGFYEEAKLYSAAANIVVGTYFGGNTMIVGAIVDHPDSEPQKMELQNAAEATHRLLIIEKLDSLSDRQFEVLDLADLQYRTAQIAAEMSISEQAVSKHKRNICDALNVQSWQAAVNCYSLTKWGSIVAKQR
jgi:DNA-binding CsgD family transcriptional regulator